MTCLVFEKLRANILDGAGNRIFGGLTPALDENGNVISGQWYCGHGLIAMLPTESTVQPYHNVDPALVKKTYETPVLPT